MKSRLLMINKLIIKEEEGLRLPFDDSAMKTHVDRE